MTNVTKKWMFLKVSSIILVPLMAWFIINLVQVYDKSYADVVIFFSTQPSKFLTSLLMVVAFFYSSLSISEIFEDYIHNDSKCKCCRSKYNRNEITFKQYISICEMYKLKRKHIYDPCTWY